MHQQLRTSLLLGPPADSNATTCNCPDPDGLQAIVAAYTAALEAAGGVVGVTVTSATCDQVVRGPAASACHRAA